jgi:simple sugar transport system ATP-binding protein
VAKRDEGVAVLIVSTELDEVLALADRIAVMYQGRIVDIVDPEQATPELLGLLMGGSAPSATAAASAVAASATPPASGGSGAT